ncbi:MAG: glycoside hydrolase family 5 protein, partial [Acidobacteriales bacterium]|nr:glycoside hydrolase family 5 protein [Terriglobales bacterium]
MRLKRREFLKASVLTTVAVAAGDAGLAWGAALDAAAEPMRLHPANPHYFLWRGKAAVLITAGEHYGAVLNLDFDYGRYLGELKAHGFDLTRVFSGAYREVPGSFNIAGNTLAPAAGRFVCPWARVGDKFDLTKWDESYFERLKAFIAKAGDHGVVVELVFFCTMYDDKVWEVSPMNARNHVNGVGSVGKYEVYDTSDRDLLNAQRTMVRKVVSELNQFDNLYYEVCNEPYERGGLTKHWNAQIIAAIVEAEAMLPNKHLIAQGFPPGPA